MISEISPNDIISYCRSDLGIEPVEGGIDDVLLAALLRRAAGMLCPCSKAVLRAALVESLAHLSENDDELASRIEELTDELIVSGDLLELADVATGDTEVKGTWVFAAPPAFVERRSGAFFLIGIIPDYDSVLSEALSRRVIQRRNTRLIIPMPGEELADVLVAEGLSALPESSWLKTPRALSAEELKSRHEGRLAAESKCAPISGLEIINVDTKPNYYRGRWTIPTDQTGSFVARRPQEFGAPIWCFAELDSGKLTRIIDLPIGNYRWRACDAAWHLQMAIDYLIDRPQRYRKSDKDGLRRLDFFSPIPLWAERRLMVLGRKCEGQKSLFAYEVPLEEAEQEELFLETELWLVPIEEQDE